MADESPMMVYYVNRSGCGPVYILDAAGQTVLPSSMRRRQPGQLPQAIGRPQIECPDAPACALLDALKQVGSRHAQRLRQVTKSLIEKSTPTEFNIDDDVPGHS
jgi:hypothetical protein